MHTRPHRNKRLSLLICVRRLGLNILVGFRNRLVIRKTFSKRTIKVLGTSLMTNEKDIQFNISFFSIEWNRQIQLKLYNSNNLRRIYANNVFNIPFRKTTFN